MQKKSTLKQHRRNGLALTIAHPVKKAIPSGNGRLQAYKSFQDSHIRVCERCRHFRRG